MVRHPSSKALEHVSLLFYKPRAIVRNRLNNLDAIRHSTEIFVSTAIDVQQVLQFFLHNLSTTGLDLLFHAGHMHSTSAKLECEGYKLLVYDVMRVPHNEKTDDDNIKESQPHQVLCIHEQGSALVVWSSINLVLG